VHRRHQGGGGGHPSIPPTLRDLLDEVDLLIEKRLEDRNGREVPWISGDRLAELMKVRTELRGGRLVRRREVRVAGHDVTPLRRIELGEKRGSLVDDAEHIARLTAPGGTQARLLVRPVAPDGETGDEQE
jgi:hypothetical protein